MPIEEFAYRFQAPVVLTGPDNKERIRLNQPAQLVLELTQYFEKGWNPVLKPDVFQELPVF